MDFLKTYFEYELMAHHLITLSLNYPGHSLEIQLHAQLSQAEAHLGDPLAAYKDKIKAQLVYLK